MFMHSRRIVSSFKILTIPLVCFRFIFIKKTLVLTTPQFNFLGSAIKGIIFVRFVKVHFEAALKRGIPVLWNAQLQLCQVPMNRDHPKDRNVAIYCHLAGITPSPRSPTLQSYGDGALRRTGKFQQSVPLDRTTSVVPGRDKSRHSESWTASIYLPRRLALRRFIEGWNDWGRCRTIIYKSYCFIQ